MSHQSRPLRALAAATIVLAALLIPPTVAARAETFHLIVSGGAEAVVGTCSFAEAPPDGTVCTDTYILYFQEGSPGDHRRAPWGAFVSESRYVVHEEGPESLGDRFGITFDTTGTFDRRHLRFASVQASVPMSDGPAVDLDLAWDMAAAPFRVAGNFGPLFEWNEVDRHFVDRCLTVVQSAHQTYRYPGVLTGTLDGVDVTTLFSPDNEPFINRGVFSLVIAPHGQCE